jgi:hypothetical protein
MNVPGSGTGWNSKSIREAVVVLSESTNRIPE